MVGLLVSNYRQRACNIEGCVNEQVFEYLPDVPEDFKTVDIMVENNRFLVNENFTEGVPDENYYKQPEFYPTWENNFYKYISEESADETYGVHPRDLIIRKIKPNSEILAVTYFHNGWVNEKYKGMQLISFYPTTGSTPLDDLYVIQSPEKVKDYFEVNFLTSNILLLEPTYPKFKNNWAQKVRLSIEVKDNIPPGKYVIAIAAIKPPHTLEETWITKYGTNYMPIDKERIGNPSFRMFIEVV